jgi:hypothetical protein
LSSHGFPKAKSSAPGAEYSENIVPAVNRIAATVVAATASRHRRDSRRPSGNSNSNSTTVGKTNPPKGLAAQYTHPRAGSAGSTAA